ncbi:MAG: porin family protein, partial [bacterium]|nr:porin family protein [bacterium]
MKKHVVFPVIVLVLVVVAGSAAAADPNWILRVAPGWAKSSDSMNEDGSKSKGKTTWALSTGLEYRSSDIVGFELGIDYADIGDDTTGSDLTVRAGLNLHLLVSDRFDAYVGPVLAWIHPVNSGVELKSGWGWGGRAGFDVALGKNWTVGLFAMFLRADLDVKDSDTGVSSL